MKTRFFWTLLSLSILPLLAGAQGVKIESHIFSGGGGTSSGGDITVTGTIGQSIVGFSTSQSYQINSGFPATLEVIPSASSESFQAWMDALTGSDRPPAGQRGAADTPAGDGMSNLLKYALGLMPMVASADAAPKVIVVPLIEGGVEKDVLGIEFRRSSDAAVSYEVEHSGNLINWASVDFTELTEPIGADNQQLVQLITTIAVDEMNMQFLRLHITAL